MRTTIEMKDEHRAALLEIAARRGFKGFSAVVEAAIETYLRGEAENTARRRKALALRGTLSRAEGARLGEAVAALRRSWR